MDVGDVSYIKDCSVSLLDREIIKFGYPLGRIVKGNDVPRMILFFGFLQE